MALSKGVTHRDNYRNYYRFAQRVDYIALLYGKIAIIQPFYLKIIGQ